MNVSITPDFEGLVNEKMQSGLYHSPGDVVNAGLRLLKERDELNQSRLAELRREVQIGLDQLERGEGIVYESPEALFAAINAKVAHENQIENGVAR